MSVEGMWALQSDQHNAPGQLAAGSIIVLETGRVFGGDSMMAFTGSYEVDGDKIVGKVHTWRWNPAFAGEHNVFGFDPGPDGIDVDFLAVRVGDNVIEGNFGVAGLPPRKGRLTKITELP